MKKLVVILCALFLLLIPGMARADDDDGSMPEFDEFVAPTRDNVLQIVLRYGALDLNNDVMIDDYAKISECDLYSAFRNDDFKWQKIRTGLREKIKEEFITYPTSIYVRGLIRLGRYDFENKIFRISGDNRISGINALQLLDLQVNICKSFLKVMPSRYLAVLDSKIHVPGFVMDETDASALLDRMQKAGNTERQVMAKFNLRISYVEKVSIDYSRMDKWSDEESFVGKSRNMNIYTRIASIEFFEDKAMTQRIYVYHPGN